MSRGCRIVLWRHGRTAWNAEGRFQSQLDPPLDDLGERQAAATAGIIRSLDPAYVVSSDLSRARATAARLGLPVQLDDRLREIDLGGWQGLTGEEAAARFPDEYAAWMAGDDVRRGGKETYEEVGARAVAALLAGLGQVPDGGTLVAVTHGGTSRAAIGSLIDLPPSAWWRLGPLGNCRWSVLGRSRRGWRLAEHNAGDPPRADAGDDR